jgi:hypothetical protein
VDSGFPDCLMARGKTDRLILMYEVRRGSAGSERNEKWVVRPLFSWADPSALIGSAQRSVSLTSRCGREVTTRDRVCSWPTRPNMVRLCKPQASRVVDQ